ncbi:type I pantothenate kinase [Methylocystis sp. ATCC 49242]|uniref:type I pantothenate kinase n=1 Tax=Methylocystis sp. ATCC 49242 TaxID=622637 RepID=UPI0001F87197|nr:type I pantothenate kinase [Methylocystis sp. ATCC 49242]
MNEAGAAETGVAISPYRRFTRAEWASLRADTPLTLTLDDLARLKSLGDPISLEEVIEIYLPLSRLLALYVAATQGLFKATQRFLGAEDGKVPYIIGVAGSVAVGKSTTARILRALLSRWPNTPKVELITTDGFLLPNAVLEREGLMEKKGFPESYDNKALLRFLSDVKAGQRNVCAPVYSHLIYDVVDGEATCVDRPDILIVEGVNVLAARPSRHPRDIPFVSDFFDFSVYLDAPEDVLERWYVERFLRLRETAFRDPRSYFRKYADLSDEETVRVAKDIWTRINLENLRNNIAPTRPRASLILTKGEDHRIEEVALRKL